MSGEKNACPLYANDKAEWRSISGWSYEASHDGRIRNARTKRLLRQRRQNSGYYVVDLYRNGKKATRLVHRLVCIAFHGLPPAGHEVAYADGKRSNCWADNLSWKTRSKNHADKRWHGTNNHGARNGQAKITARDVRKIKRLAAKKELSQSAIGRIFGISQTQVWKIAHDRKWRHLIS